MLRSHSPNNTGPYGTSPPEAATLSIPAALGMLAASLCAFGLHLWVAIDHARGSVNWDAWRHRPGGDWSWTPFIHPPPYGEFLRLVEWLSNATGSSPVQVHLAIATIVTTCTLLVATGLYRRVLGGGTGLATAVLLLLLSPASLRPFEQYPLACLLLTGAVWMLVSFAQHGRLSALFLGTTLGLGAVSFHLSSWFVLGPMLVFLGLWFPSRRRPLLVAAATSTALFLACTVWPNHSLWPLFDQPHVYFGEQRALGTFRWADINLEWSNPALFLPLLLWIHPRLRRASPLGTALATTSATYLAITGLLMASGLALTGDRASAHHYFELIDPLLIGLAVLTVQLAVQEWFVSSSSLRRNGLLGLLVLSQTVLLISGLLFLREVAESPWMWLDFHRVELFGDPDSTKSTDAGWIAVSHASDPDSSLFSNAGRLELIVEFEGSDPVVLTEDVAGYDREFPRLGLAFSPDRLPVRYRLKALLYSRDQDRLIQEVRSAVGWTVLSPGKLHRVELPPFRSDEPSD